MELNFTEEQKMLRDSVSRFATQELNAGLAERDRNGTFAKDLWLKCGEQGPAGSARSAGTGRQRPRSAFLRHRTRSTRLWLS